LEWVVDKILFYSGSSQDSIFEVLWKAGDITWLLYIQIKHLNTLKGLQGVGDINFLPSRNEKPPHQDPQVFLGAISPCEPQDYKNKPGFIFNCLLSFPRKFLPYLIAVRATAGGADEQRCVV